MQEPNLIKRGTHYVLECHFKQRQIAKSANFWWNPKLKEWYSLESSNAYKLIGYCADPVLKAEIDAQAHQGKREKKNRHREFFQAVADNKKDLEEYDREVIGAPVMELDTIEGKKVTF